MARKNLLMEYINQNNNAFNGKVHFEINELFHERRVTLMKLWIILLYDDCD